MSDLNQTSEPSFIPEELSSESKECPPALSPQKKQRRILKEIMEYVELFVIAICVVMLMFSCLFRICTVNGESMENTLFAEEKLIVSDLFYTPKRGDVIVFHQTETLNEPIVKRVIATAGETVNIVYTDFSMTVTVTEKDGNQIVLEENYMKYEGWPLYRSPLSLTVPEGSLFVMGDNRNNSKDSRHSDIGMVDERRVLGKVLFRITPLSRFGSIY